MAKDSFRVAKSLSITPRSSAPTDPVNGDLYYDSTLNKFRKYENGAWSDIGSGSGPGGGGINYELDPYFQEGVGSWTLFGDSTDLDGGTTTGVTFTVDAASTSIYEDPYVGVGILSKDTADRDGIGVAKAYTIPEASQSDGFIYVSGRFTSTSGLNAGDIKIAAYDVTNSVLLNIVGIANSNLHGISANAVGEFKCRIPLANNTTSIRLGFYWNDNTSNAKDFRFSDLKIGPEKLLDSPIFAEISGFSGMTLVGDSGTAFTNNTVTANAWRMNDRLHIEGRIIFTGVPGTATGSFRLKLPTGYTIDTTKLPLANSANNRAMDGFATFRDQSTANYALRPGYNTADAADRFRLVFLSSTTDQYVSASVPIATIVNNDTLDFRASFPIVEWANQNAVISSSELMNKVAGGVAYRSSAANHTSVGAWQKVPLDATLDDSLFEFDSVNNQFVSKFSGYRLLSGSVRFASISTGRIGCQIQVNSAAVSNQLIFGNSGGGINLIVSAPVVRVFINVGDTISLHAFQEDSASEAYGTPSSDTFLSVQGVPDLSVYGVYSASGLLATRVYTTSGSPHTYEKNPDARYVRVKVVGGGGAGGGATTTSSAQLSVGAGGGGGGYAEKIILSSALGNTETITVGAGGTGSAGAAGGNGGTTSFGAHCSATGGAGGEVLAAGSTNVAGGGGAAGTGSGGDIVISGQSGGPYGRNGANFVLSGSGGSSALGHGSMGALFSVSNSGAAGGTGDGYGAGGRGAASGQNQASTRSGGAGRGGFVIVEEYA